jgi:hypothetical protein
MCPFVSLLLLLACLGSCKETKSVYSARNDTKRNASGWPGAKYPDDVFAGRDAVSPYDSLSIAYQERLGSLAIRVIDSTKFEQSKNKFIKKIQSGKRFQKLSAATQDTILKLIKELPPQPYLSEKRNRKLSKAGLIMGATGSGSLLVSLLTLAATAFAVSGGAGGSSLPGAPFVSLIPALLLGIPAIVMGSIAFKRSKNPGIRNKAAIAIILGSLTLVAGVIIFAAMMSLIFKG